jgi:hypothetical protein
MKNKWISVTDKLPEANDRVLIYIPLYNNVCTGENKCGRMIRHLPSAFGEITHWRKLPKRPRKIKL